MISPSSAITLSPHNPWPAHSLLRVPDKQFLVPPHASTPTLLPKHTPIHSCSEFRMSIHSPLFYEATCFTCIGPYPTAHIITSSQQYTRIMRTPGQLPNGILMSPTYCHTLLISDIEASNDIVYTSSCYDCISVFIPIMCQSFGCFDGSRLCSVYWYLGDFVI